MSFHATFEAFVGGLKAAIPVAQLLAATTTAKWDDDLVSFAKTVVNNDGLVKWFHDLICQHPEVVTTSGAARDQAIHSAVSASLTDKVRQAFEALGYSIEMIQKYAPSVVRLVLTMLGYRS